MLSVIASQAPVGIEGVPIQVEVDIRRGLPGIDIVGLPDGAVREAYRHRVRVNGGFAPYSWSISAGSLPAGLSFNASKGAITGIPTTPGVKKFTVQVTDSQNPAAAVTKVLSIKIEPSILFPLWFSPMQ